MRYLNAILLLLAFPALYSQAGPGKEKIIIRTEMGEIHVRIDLVRAPVTSANFLRYIDAGLFDSTCFYRVVRPDNQPKDSVLIGVIQGGRYEDEETGGFPAVPHESTEMTGIRHRDGVISMARWTPGTATSEFFICVGDQPDLDYGGKRNPDGQTWTLDTTVMDTKRDTFRLLPAKDFHRTFFARPSSILHPTPLCFILAYSDNAKRRSHKPRQAAGM